MTSGRPDPAFWRGRRVLLTGHTGFKGAWMALWLADMGAHVTGLSLPPESEPNLFDLAGVASACARSHVCDIRDAARTAAFVKEAEPQIVIHMAAQALVRRSYREPVATFATNVLGTLNVMEAARQCSNLEACLVVTSDKVYENDGRGVGFEEGARLGGDDPYSASKAAAEIAVASYRASYFAGAGPMLATARGGNVIGGGDFSEDRVVPDVWRAYRANDPVVLRYPDATRPWQHVLDCLCGYLVYAERLAQRAVAETSLNFGPRGGRILPVRDLVTAMQKSIGARAGMVEAAGPQPKEMPALALSSERAERALGWRSQLEPEEAIDWTAAWYKAFADRADARRVTVDQIERFVST